MTMFLTNGPGAGLEPRRQEVTLKAHAAISVGDVLMIEPTVKAADDLRFDTTAAPRSDNAKTWDNEFGIGVVALEDVASGANGRFLISGLVDANIEGTDPVAVGEALEMKVGITHTLIAGTTAGAKVFGFALVAQAAGSVVKTRIMFDGSSGFGTVHA